MVDFLKLHGETYYLTLNSTPRVHHTFSVSNSVKILSGVVDKSYYSKTIISLMATPFTDGYGRFHLSAVHKPFYSRLCVISSTCSRGRKVYTGLR